MDFHPIVVHFPIALLTIYAVLEILPLKRWYDRLPWDTVKTIFAVIGILGAKASIITGLIAEEQGGGGRMVETHEKFAFITLGIFGILAAARLVTWLTREYPWIFVEKFQRLSFIGSIATFCVQRWVAAPLALLGLIAITITGAIGGIMTAGPNTDPIAKLVYSLLFE